jgi:hypothetical protein
VRVVRLLVDRVRGTAGRLVKTHGRPGGGLGKWAG